MYALFKKNPNINGEKGSEKACEADRYLLYIHEKDIKYLC